MNFLRRLLLRLRAPLAYLAAEMAVRSPLPPPRTDPQIELAQLVSRADAQGVVDARAAVLDSWSFGGPTDPVSEQFDPAHIRGLRHERDAAIRERHERQHLTESRIAALHRMRAESQERMNGAVTRMAGLAVRDRVLDGPAEEQVALAEPAQPGADDADDTGELPWEGETRPLGGIWRLLIVVGLLVAELPVQVSVFDYFLSSAGQATLAHWMAVLTAVILVVGPFVAGLLLRHGQATGSDRRIGYAVLVFAGSWLLIAAILGMIRAAILETGPVGAERLHITPVTIVLMFVALLLVVGAMAFMLGLARRHPFQEAYLRHRDSRDRADVLMQATATRLNPAYRDPERTETALGEDDERALREAYAAAEEAYFAALTRTVGDPAFTEAVQHRRGLRVAA